MTYPRTQPPRRVTAAALLLATIASCAAAQSPSPSPFTPGPGNSMSFFDVMAISVFLAVFFPIFAVLLAFTCLRVFRPPDEPTAPGTSTSEWSHHKECLNADEIAALPLVSYRTVREHRIDPLECAVCLLEFDGDDELRLLPTCPHSFHAECIGIWLRKNVTCPLCRASVLDAFPMPHLQPASSSAPPLETESAPHSPPVQQTVLLISDITHDDEEYGRNHDDVDEMTRTQSLATTRCVAGGQALARSNSTGHERPSGMSERFALRLPEHVRMEILMSHRLRHVTSAVTSVSIREEGAHDLGPGVGGNVRSAMSRLLSLFVPGAGWKGDDEEMSGKGGGSSRRRRDD